jgi:UDP-GlcNAc:undecaprenyl-phosphate GlcNAc-1-phosphate transferase
MSSPLFFSFIASLAICMALIPALMATAGRLHFLDLPGGRKIHPAPVAKVGGLAFAAGAFAAMLLWAPKDQLITSSLAAGAVILLFGAWDDRVGLGYRAKFFGQVIAAVIVVAFGGIHVTTVPFLTEETLPLWVAAPLTVFLLVAVTNALNLADGLDGLAGGLSLLSFVGMAYLAYQAGDWVVMSMMVPVLGGLLGFLRFNTYPARIFMGDAGSQFLGFYLGVCAIVLTDPMRGPYSPALASLIWGLPILDTTGVMIQRWTEGRPLFSADKNHVHHKLLGLGLSHRGAVLAIYGVQAMLVGLAYVLRWQADAVILSVYGVFACAVLSLFLRRRGRLVTPVCGDASESGSPEAGASDGRHMMWPVKVLAVAVPAFLGTAVLLLSGRVPVDVAYVAVGLFLLVSAAMVAAPPFRPIAVRLGLYVGGTFVIYLLEPPAAGAPSGAHLPLNLFFLAVTLLIMLAMRFGVKQRFQTTPLDYLMVCLAFAIPFLPEMRVGDINLSVLTAKMIVMFLAVELMLHAFPERLARFGLVSLWVLFMLGLRAWWS